MKTKIVKIGNSQGVRIPKVLLKQTDLGEQVKIELKGKSLYITSDTEIDPITLMSEEALREGWDGPEEDEAWKHLQPGA